MPPELAIECMESNVIYRSTFVVHQKLYLRVVAILFYLFFNIYLLDRDRKSPALDSMLGYLT